MKPALAVVALAIVVLFVLPVLRPPGEAPATTVGMPWQIELQADGGSRVFGVQPGVSTLAQVSERFGTDLQLALIAAPGEAGTLEAYYDQVSIGPLRGKLVLSLAADTATVEGIRTRAAKSEFMESTTRRYTLSPDDAAWAQTLPVAALTLIPGAQLDAAVVEQRFGAPAEKVAIAERVEQWLYPDQGLSVTLDGKGREVLQYVAPRDFDALVRRPLQQGRR